MLISRAIYYLASIPTLLWGVKNWPALAALGLGGPARGPRVLRLRNGCRFRVRTLLDVWVIKETCLDRQYERAGAPIEDGWRVLDVGAGLGDFAIGVARMCPRSVVYAYEPFPPSYTLLEENLRLNGVQNVRAFPCAIGGRAGALTLHAVSAEAVQQSTAARSGPAGGLTVPAITLEQVFAELQLTGCDYLKMDCEGAEYEILFHTDPATLRRIQRVCLEYHEGVAEFSRDDLVQFFTRHGLRVRLTPSPAHRHLGLLYAER